ncbi:hypothetical protein H2O64_13835 [Kordia sp. YSTF-M3]|uniref:YD repeat-containing protein n=1 Tax=Kordia aestuariivivens TaxID=2759037 RepID=A0ABR7QB41_9FLAO|nr:hypothetical protein [Kordia aestuariivivens]MBC8755752.1 hypothetical protein [Kordia aestuariivivens]
MKLLYILILISLISCATETKPKNDCLVNEGVKTAKVFLKNDATGVTKEDFMHVEFDKIGNPLKVVNTIHKITSTYSYENEKLVFVIEEKSRPDFYMESEKDVVEKSVDTLYMTKYNNDGRAIESIDSDGIKTVTTFINCDEEQHSTYYSNGKKIQDVTVQKENGNLKKTIRTLYEPETEIRTSTYYDYKFDEHGHWTERSCQHQNKEEVTEVRVLEYY